MAEPELLMLDEPSLGLAPVIVDEMFRVLRITSYNVCYTKLLRIETPVAPTG